MKIQFSRQLGSLSMKISAFVVGIVLVFFTINSIVSIGTAYDDAVSSTYEKMEAVMENTARHVDLRLLNGENITDLMAKTGSAVLTDSTKCKELLMTLINSSPDISAATLEFAPHHYPTTGKEYAPTIFISSQTGDTIYEDITLRGFHYLDSKYNDINWSEGAQGRTTWSAPYTSVSDHLNRVSYSSPVYDKDGKVIAVLCSTFTIDWIQQMLMEDKPNEACQLIAITKEGDHIYQQPTHSTTNALKEALSMGNDDYVEVIRLMMKGEKGKKIISMPEETYLYFTPVQRTQWSICYSIPTDVITSKPLAMADNMLYAGIALMLLMFVALSIGIYYIIRPFTNNLKAVTESNASLNSDLKIASAIQQSMLPQDGATDMSCGQMQIHGMLRPAKMVGGDLYDYFYDNGRFYFCIGDISGKGVPAAMYMTITRTLVRVMAESEKDVDKIINRLNKTMSRSQNSMFCTLFLGSIDLATGKMSCCNAGHNPPVIIHRTGDGPQAEYLRVTPGAAIGVFDDETYSSEDFQLIPGDSIYLYTDGVTEAEDINHKLLGEAATLDAVRSAAASDNVADVVSQMLAVVDAHAGKATQSDDITMLMLRFTPTDRLTLTNDVSQISKLGEWTRIICNRNGISDHTSLFNIQLAVEEAVVNVMNYAYPGQKNQPIYLEAKVEESAIDFIIRDNGVQYDPTQNESPDIDLPTEECNIGGLGVFLYTQLLDAVTYKYENNQNVLTLTINKVDS